ncbi:MAG: helix-turn-helix transcriptional regulator [Oscillospiraceae bacterium]|jgi:transcriptional regulator with XRE-family HTH domain|nr:helix-turn-helix transcriptional regulator [Oscillospiraceae bacterium]
MNNDFPRILSLLRKERRLSQKQVSLDLEIAQALLSHYEKGKRECGLDFLVKVADYYGVSTDYLLGRSASSNGTFITENDIPEPAAVEKAGTGAGNISATLSKKMIISSIDAVFSLLSKIKNQKLTSALSNFLTLSVYSCFRLTYHFNPKNDGKIFGIRKELALRCAQAGRAVSEGIAVAEANDNGANAPLITTASLENEYRQQAAALLSLVKNSEHSLKKIL